MVEQSPQLVVQAMEWDMKETLSPSAVELEVNFFYQIGNGIEHLAQAHSLAIQKFLAEEEINQARSVLYHQLGAYR